VQGRRVPAQGHVLQAHGREEPVQADVLHQNTIREWKMQTVLEQRNK